MTTIRIYTKAISLNNAYSTNQNGRRFMTATGKAYKEELAWKVRQNFAETYKGDCEAWFIFGFSDKRKRDLDNLIKLTLDSVVTGQGIEDDSQIVKLTAEKIYNPQPFVEIRIEERKENV